MEAIILAGGFGTRLSHVIKNLPKPMAPINGVPFLKILLDDLHEKGVTHVVLAVCHMKSSIIDYFGREYNNIKIDYSEEKEPLLTGGAIKQALQLCVEEYVFVINGDTYFDVNLKEMALCNSSKRFITVAIKEMYNFERYGSVVIKNDRIISFMEKQFCEHGYINGGIYYINKNLLENITAKSFSFETDFLEKNCSKLDIGAFKSEGYFIDIGIPEDYLLAQTTFK